MKRPVSKAKWMGLEVAGTLAVIMATCVVIAWRCGQMVAELRRIGRGQAG